MFKLVLEKAEEPEIKLSTSVGSSKKQEFQKNIYFSFINYAKAFDCIDHNRLGEILQASFNNTWTVNSQMFKLVLEKAEEPDIKFPKFAVSSK